jgi:hypothetical protein
MSIANERSPHGPENSFERRVLSAVGVAGLFLLAAAGLAVSGMRFAEARTPVSPQEAEQPKAKWTILFRSDDPSKWDTRTKGVAIPLDSAPAKFRYLRLRRMDTDEAMILRMDPDQLRNGTHDISEKGYWWNGTSKKGFGGHHLGIVEGPRHKFPAKRGMITLMWHGWDGFTGSGFGHAYGVDDKQRYAWRGKEIPRTVFEIAVTYGPLGPEERRNLLPQN